MGHPQGQLSGNARTETQEHRHECLCQATQEGGSKDPPLHPSGAWVHQGWGYVVPLCRSFVVGDGVVSFR
jgi:hypothetical protein